MNTFAIFGPPMGWLIYAAIFLITLEYRENCRRKFCVVLAVCFVFQIMIRVCLLTQIAWIQEINLAKLLTFAMAVFMMFVGGRYVSGGWSVVGFYIAISDVLIGTVTRFYWMIWSAVTHATVQEMMHEQQLVEADAAGIISMLLVIILLPVYAGPLRNIQNYPIGRSRIIKLCVIIYLISGVSPLMGRMGFEKSGHLIFPQVFWHAFFLLMFFWVVLAIQNDTVLENRNLLYLRQKLSEEQLRLVRRQEKEARYLRHDIKKHLDYLEFLCAQHPEVEMDSGFVQYRNELLQLEETFRRVVYCDSMEMNLSLSQMEQYCTAAGIPITIQLKRLHFSGWSAIDQVLFGASLNALLKEENGLAGFRKVDNTSKSGSGISGKDLDGFQQGETGIRAVRITGDCIRGQNIMRMEFKVGGTMDHVRDGNRDSIIKVGANPETSSKSGTSFGSAGAEKENVVQGIRLLLNRYEGAWKESEEDRVCYVMTWQERAVSQADVKMGYGV